MGLSELGHDPRFTGFPERFAHKAELVAILQSRFVEKTTADWLALLRGHVPCAPVNTVAQALDDEQVRAREMFVEVDHPQFGRIREVASPIRTEGEIRNPSPAPALGQHTEAILSEILGYGSQTIARLRAEGVIGK
jgi:crotonobetainyl-CoA:carnitine CoA-transferase CaiB-like acyl-CoA transferase